MNWRSYQSICFYAAFPCNNVFFNNMAIVIGPTPPGPSIKNRLVAHIFSNRITSNIITSFFWFHQGHAVIQHR